MPGTPSLPDELVALLAEMYGEANPATGKRWTLRELAAFCALPPWSITTCHTTVRRTMAPLRAERARDAREIARERIARALPQQLDALDTMIEALADDFTAAKTPTARAAALDAYQKGLALKLRYSGVGEAIEMSGDLNVDAALTVVDARSQLAAQLARAALGAAAGTASGTPGEPVAGSGGGSPS